MKSEGPRFSLLYPDLADFLRNIEERHIFEARQGQAESNWHSVLAFEARNIDDWHVQSSPDTIKYGEIGRAHV